MGKAAVALNDEMIKLISQTAATTAIEQYKKEQEEKVKKEQDLRLHNVKLLLRNYRKFLNLANDVEGKVTLINNRMMLEAIDLGELIVPSIKKSKERTLAIVRFLDRTLELYKDLCEQEGEESVRKYETIHLLYLAEVRMNVTQIAQQQNLAESMVYKNIKKACEDLVVLLFGVDSLKMVD